MEHPPLRPIADAVYREAIERCGELFERARDLSLLEPDACALATTDLAGHVTVRTVLLRAFDDRGFVFYSNSQSRKGDQLAENPRAALCCYWDGLNEQVRVEGDVRETSDDESDYYWRSRPRNSQLASAASDQSRPLHDRETYEARVRDLERIYAGQDVPRPRHWVGYRVEPVRLELWRGREARMHERTVYERVNGEWEKFLLYP